MNKKRKIMIASILVLSVALLTCIAVIGNRKKVISTDRSAQFDNPQINAWCKKMFERHE